MTSKFRFIIGGKVREIHNIDPQTTVLNWLRYKERRTGTKEGCAEGDCGACTVVLRELTSKGITYRAVNACILFMPMLDGKELLTIEDIKAADGSPHIIQEKMKELHGSQCGFCTPGIVMSLYAAHQTKELSNTQNVNDTLAGNLCRCTGYGPIIDAANASIKVLPANEKDAAIRSRLESIQRHETLSMTYWSSEGPSRTYVAPVSIAEFASLYKLYSSATILAGGTDVGLWITKQGRDLNNIIYLGNVVDCRSITETKDGVKVDAGVSYSSALSRLAEIHPSFGEYVRRIGSRQIRNSGTIGGNIANGSPIGDMMPPLIALRARLTLRCGDERREIALEDYFLSYGKQDLRPSEFVESVFIPFNASHREFRTYKISKRFDQDISALSFAFSAEIKNGLIKQPVIAMGGMAGVPKRALYAEKFLEGQEWSAATIRKSMDEFDRDYEPLTDMRASADYRLKVAKNLLMKSWLDINGKTTSHVLNIREPLNV